MIKGDKISPITSNFENIRISLSSESRECNQKSRRLAIETGKKM
jgi:hypothetical protein